VDNIKEKLLFLQYLQKKVISVMSKYIILLPLYNDWDNLNILVNKIKEIAKKDSFNFRIVVVNDCSTKPAKINFVKSNLIHELLILNLSKNLGSQRAIAIGLKFINEHYNKIEKDSFTIVMDSDGQDNPEVLSELIKINNKKYDNDLIAVERANRSEPLWFKILYKLHKYILFILTGKLIKFGNFTLIKNSKLHKIVYSIDLWAAYPAAIVTNYNKITKIKKDRQKRFSGNTKMNFFKLFDHAGRVFSVFKGRILLSSLFYIIISFFILNLNIYFLTILYLFVFINSYIFFVYFKNLINFKKINSEIDLEIKNIF
tara:strand:- start:5192 stop:6136 length:945 start_codon:yes stop_codon:yes gene_type:complete